MFFSKQQQCHRALVKNFIQKSEDLVYLFNEIAPLICQKNTLTCKVQYDKQKGQVKVISAVSHFSSYN